MRHKKAFRKFSRTPAHRRAMFRNMATSLLWQEHFETTVQKAKDLRAVVEKLITVAKENSLHRRRKAYDYLQDKAVVHKLFAEIGPRYKERPGGYTRVLRTRVRPGDGAELAIIELVEGKVQKSTPKKSKAKVTAKAKSYPKKTKETKEEAASKAAKPKKSAAKSKAKAKAKTATSKAKAKTKSKSKAKAKKS